MMLLEAAGGAVLVAATIFVAVLLHMRRALGVAARTIEGVRPAAIPALRDECIAVFERAFGERLDLDDFEESARVLSGRMDHPTPLRRAFAQDDFDWYCVLPLGAFLGELVRVHGNGAWRASQTGGVELVIPVGEESARIRPFHKVLTHLTAGEPGEIHVYLEASRQLEKVAGPREGGAPAES
jgi:hypothetical protein